MSINRKEKRHEYTRGAEVMRHEFGLYFSALYFSFMIALIAGLGTSVFVFNALLEANEGEVVLKRIAAEFNVATGKSQDKVVYEVGKGAAKKVYEVPSAALLEITAKPWASIKSKMWISAGVSLVCAIALFFITNGAWRRFGRNVGADEVVRGSEFVEASAVRKELKQGDKTSGVTFGGVPLEKGKEVLNMMVSGAIGTGKSVAITEALVQIRASKTKAIIYDPSGEYIERFYRDGKDVILNPFDERSPPWRPWNEVRSDFDYANVAEAFIPVSNAKEPFWEQGAQMVLEDILSRLAKSGQATNRALIETINILTLEEIQALVQGLAAGVLMDPAASKTALGIRMNVVQASRALRFVSDGGEECQFSIRDWVTKADEDSWLFMSAREDMLPTVRPMITAWMDTALRAIMTLPPDRNRLIWNVVDELASLNKVSTLKEVTTRARKYGLASLLGYQNIAQLREIYGNNDAQTIVSMCQNTLTLRVPDFQTAEYIAKNLGEQELNERDENISYGADATRDGVTITTKRGTRALVTPSEIQGLPDLTGFIRLAGRNDVIKIKLEYKTHPVIALAFVPRVMSEYSLEVDGVEAAKAGAA